MELAGTATPRRVLGTALVLWQILYALGCVLLAPGSVAVDFFSAGGWTLSSLVAGIRCLRVAALRRSERTRIAWLCFGVGCLAWSAGIVYWAIIDFVLDQDFPVPSVADIGYLSLAPLFALGVLHLQTQRPSFALSLKQTADLGLGLCSCGLVLALALYAPLRAALGDPWRAVVAVSFPITRGAALLFGLVFYWQHVPSARRRVPLLIVLALSVLAVMAALYAHSLLLGPFESGSWFDSGWVLAFAFVIWASYEEQWLGTSPPDSALRPAPTLDPLVPMLGISMVVLGLIVFRDRWTPELLPAFGVAGVGLGVFSGLRAYATVRLEKEWREELRRQEQELRRVENELFHAQKLHVIHSLSSTVAHEFRNLIMVMMGCLDLARQHLAAGKNADALLKQVDAALVQANDMTTRLVGLSRRQTPTLRLVNCHEALEQMATLLRRVLPRTISVEGPSTAAVVGIRVDAALLDQALLNLAVNARDAMLDQGGHLRLDVRVERAVSPASGQPKDYAVLSVEDTGGGIPSEVQSRIFEPFFTTKPEDKGTGLGLAMVHSFVCDHGGFIKLHSKLGQGTRFELYIPASASVNE